MRDGVSLKYDVEATIAALQRLKVLSQKSVIRSAGRSGARVWRDLAVDWAPDDITGKLRRELKLRQKINFGSGMFSVGTSRAAPYAHLVELGALPHDITFPKGNKFLPPGAVMKHPGAMPKPFLVPAYEHGKSKAISNVKKNLKRKIEKEAAKGGKRGNRGTP